MSSRKKYMAGISIALAVTALGAAALTGGCGSSQPVVKDVDHIATSTSQPEQLFTFFTGTLGLPAAWPFVQYPGFATGGVYLGNVNMETLLLEGVSASSDGTMTFQSGPAIRIIKGSTDMIATLIIEVASLDTAKAFLQKNGLLGKSTGSELTIEPSKVQGLDIQLVQQAGK